MPSRRTKIVCTIGPATSRKSMLERLMRAGMDVARLNFSHGDHASHAQVIADLRDLSRKHSRPLAILQDLCGPKVRLGSLPHGEVMLKRGDTIGFAATGCEEGSGALPLPIPELIAALRPGAHLLLDDGKIGLKVTSCEGEPDDPKRIVWARCTAGGCLRSRKGVTAPGTRFAIPAVTEKDRHDLRFGLQQGVDWVAVSFVRSVEDLLPIYETMEEMGRSVPVLAKIEKAEAVRHFASLLAKVDGIMVARGDLGVEMDFDEVPLVQKQLIKACNRAAKPVITATQMLESMISCPRPTRAEAADVANAILDGTDAVMLSAETAAGEFPLESVQTMAKIALRTEAAFFQDRSYASRLQTTSDVTAAVGRASADIARAIGASAILCATSSGSTARQVASHRPPMPILGVTTSEATYHTLALSWGVQPCLAPAVYDTDAMMQATLASAEASRTIRTGDRVVLTAGVPVNQPGTTNLIRVLTIGETLDTGKNS